MEDKKYKLYFRAAVRGIMVTLSDGKIEYSQIYNRVNEDDFAPIREELAKVLKKGVKHE